MANTLTITALTEILYQARDIVAAEPTGFIQSCLINSGSEGVSTGGTVSSAVTGTATIGSSYTPSMTLPSGDDQTVSVETMTMGQAAVATLPITGSVARQLENTGGYQPMLVDFFAQAMRGIRNNIEAHVGQVIYRGASRGFGTAGTAPFGSNFNEIASLRKILLDNGCPVNDGNLSLIINTTAGVNLRNLANLQKVNEAGNDVLLRRGELLNLQGFSIKESAGVSSHTKGGAASSLINNASDEVVGETTLTLDTITVNTTGFVAGDIITHASDTANKYVVRTGLAATSGDIVIAKPGLRIKALNNDAVTIGNSYTANVGFHRNAVELAIRPPAQPPGGDAGDHMLLYDEKSGLSFDVAWYKGYGMGNFVISCLYQAKVWKPEFVATLLG